jgi:hypothetical protein
VHAAYHTSVQTSAASCAILSMAVRSETDRNVTVKSETAHHSIHCAPRVKYILLVLLYTLHSHNASTQLLCKVQDRYKADKQQ